MSEGVYEITGAIEVFRNERGTLCHRKTCAVCGAPFEALASISNRLAKCEDCKTPAIGKTASGFGFLTREFAPYLEGFLRQIGDVLRREKGIDDDHDSGAIEALALDVSTLLGRSHEAIVRRIYDYRNGVCRFVDTEVVDACFLAVGRIVEDEEATGALRVWPTTKSAAVEIVTIRAEEAGETLTETEVAERADRLLYESIAAAFDMDVETVIALRQAEADRRSRNAVAVLRVAA